MKDFALKVTVIFAILLAAIALWQVRSIVALFVLSLVMAATVRAPIAYLMARRVRRGVAMLMVYGLALGGLLTLFYLLSYPLAGEFEALTQKLTTVYTRLQSGRIVFGRWDALLADRLPTPEQIAALLSGDQMTVIGQSLLNVTQIFASSGGQLALALVLSVYWTADQLRFERLWLSLLPSGQRGQARTIWHALEAQVGAYIRSEIAQSVLAGALLIPGFWLLGLEYPVLAALLVSVAWFIPLVGVVLAIMPLGLLVWLEAGALAATAAVLYTVVILAFLEFVVERRLYTQTRYTKVLVILVMLAMADAYGIVGLLLAPPVATAIEVLLTQLLDTAPKSASQVTPEIDVAAMQARLQETRLLVSRLEGDSALRLSNMADRLDGLLQQS